MAVAKELSAETKHSTGGKRMKLRKVLACRAGALALGTAFLVAGTIGA